MEPETAQDYIDEAIASLDMGEVEQAQGEALIAIAKVLLEFLLDGEDDSVPAGPIPYEDYGDSNVSRP